MPWSEDNPAAGAWMPDETIVYLFDAVAAERFYIICPDNDVSEETDKKRIAWAAGDIIGAPWDAQGRVHAPSLARRGS